MLRAVVVVLSLLALFVLLPSPSSAHEASCHVCTGDVDASVRTSACQLLVLAANNLNAVGDECRGIQYQGVTEGCCDTPADFCNLCEQGGNLPNPDQRISVITCAEVGGLASFGNNDATCTDFQATYGLYCGCNNPVAAQAARCNICETSGPILPRRVVQAPQFQSDDTAPPGRFCGLLEFFAQYTAAPSLNSCGAYQDAFAADCCLPRMTNAPVVAPTEFPVVSPTNVPVVSPTDVPVVSPTDVPVVSPTNVPLVAATGMPATDAPMMAPPTNAPVTGKPFAAPVVMGAPLETVEAAPRSASSMRGNSWMVVVSVGLLAWSVNY